MKKKVLIVGGVAGGASAAARLRRLDEEAEIILFERGEYISFANCGLPYYIGGEIQDQAALTLQTPTGFHSRFRVDVRPWQEVTAIDPQEKIVTVRNLTTGTAYSESYDKLILSPGAAPYIPAIPGVESDRVFTLRNIPDTLKVKNFLASQKPKRAVIVGGGFIGIEMAENLVRDGLAVTLIELGNQILPPLDFDMACEVQGYLSRMGVKLLLNNELTAIHETAEGLTLTTQAGTLRADLLILSIGVRPESGLAKEAGLRMNGRGFVVVDPEMQSSDPHIYAVGDAVEVVDFITGQRVSVPLAGPANKQGRIAADNICGLGSRYEGTQGSAILKVFDMTVASTGLNEKTAQRLDISYDKSFTFSASHAGYYPGASHMSIKTLFDPENGKILGAQIVGFEGVDKRCDVMATAIRAQMTAFDLARLELCYAPPYSSAKDPVNMAGFVIENLLTGKMKHFHWHQVDALPRDGSVTLLDTRTPMEYESGHIEDFMNIPLDTLRENLSKLDRKKPVFLTCQIGLRGYIATRILMQNGFEVYNLSGGFRQYAAIRAAKQ